MPDRTTAPGAAGDGSSATARAELVAANEEIHRLRTRLVEINAELGDVRGRLTALEARSRKLAKFALGLWLRIPVLNRLPHLVRRHLLSRRD